MAAEVFRIFQPCLEPQMLDDVGNFWEYKSSRSSVEFPNMLIHTARPNSEISSIYFACVNFWELNPILDR